MCRTAVELSIAGTECARLARVGISASVVGDSKAHYRSRNRRRRGRRARDILVNGDPTCMRYCCGSLHCRDAGGTRAVDLNDDEDASSACSSGKICPLGCSRSYVLAKVGMRHRRQVGQVQVSTSRSL